EWGLLIADAKTGETLYQQNADRYFLPASNMKLFTTALALAKLGPDYRFHTTLETRACISNGVLTGDLALVGRGDPNLSNRKFPYVLQEEFDGPPEKVLAELADGVARKGIKEISGDVIGDDSYFPRERYPSGWEIDDMVWEYGAAISAIAVEQPAEHAAAVLKHLLEDRGIRVDGVARARHEALRTAADPAVLAEHVSVPLGEAVKLINKISQNLHAEMLLRTVARQGGVWA